MRAPPQLLRFPPLTRTPLWKPPIWGRSGRGHCRKCSANFCDNSANIPQNFHTLSGRNQNSFLQISASFPQNFRTLSGKKPFANDPTTELLNSFRNEFEREQFYAGRVGGETREKAFSTWHCRKIAGSAPVMMTAKLQVPEINSQNAL